MVSLISIIFICFSKFCKIIHENFFHFKSVLDNVSENSDTNRPPLLLLNVFMLSYLHFWHNLDFPKQWHHLSIQGFHGQDVLGIVIKLHTVNPSKQLLQMCLDHIGISRLSQDL